jgi:hypothetical protein
MTDVHAEPAMPEPAMPERSSRLEPASRPEPSTAVGEPPPRSGHPAVEAVIRAMANAADLSPGDQIAEYEAVHQALQETLATIDQA